MRFVFLVLLLASCRNETGPAPTAIQPPATEEEPSTMLTSSSQLPTCSEANNKQLFYILDLKKFVSCDSNDWIETEVKTPGSGAE